MYFVYFSLSPSFRVFSPTHADVVKNTLRLNKTDVGVILTYIRNTVYNLRWLIHKTRFKRVHRPLLPRVFGQRTYIIVTRVIKMGLGYLNGRSSSKNVRVLFYFFIYIFINSNVFYSCFYTTLIAGKTEMKK